MIYLIVVFERYIFNTIRRKLTCAYCLKRITTLKSDFKLRVHLKRLVLKSHDNTVTDQELMADLTYLFINESMFIYLF